jgi:pullulanase/glycogen debranching enzyme
MQLQDWQDPERRVLGMYIHGEGSSDVDERGRPLLTDPLLLLVNAGRRPCYFRLPELPKPGRWEKKLNTARPGVQAVRLEGLNLAALSLILLTCRASE